MRQIAAVLLAIACLIFVVACDDEDTPAPSTTGDATPSPTFPLSTGEFPGRDPLESTYPTPLIGSPIVDTPRLIDVRIERYSGFDRLAFEFTGATPTYHVELVEQPITDCATGEPIAVEGEAFLEVRLSPASALDPNGERTFDPAQVRLDAPTMLETRETCDAEGELTWVIGLPYETDFRVTALGRPIMAWLIYVDAKRL